MKKFGCVGMLALALAGCSNGTPDCASSEVESLFRNRIVSAALNGAVENAAISVQRSQNNKFTLPYLQKRLEIAQRRQSRVEESFELTNIRTVERDESLDTYLCEAEVRLIDAIGEDSIRAQTTFKVFSVENGEDDFQIEYADGIADLATRSLFDAEDAPQL